MLTESLDFVGEELWERVDRVNCDGACDTKLFSGETLVVEESSEDGLVRWEECAEVKRRDFLGALPVDGNNCRDL